MVSTLEALERYRVPHSAAKLMTSAVYFVSRYARVTGRSGQCGFEASRSGGSKRGAEGDFRTSLPDATPFREARLRRDCTTDRLTRA